MRVLKPFKVGGNIDIPSSKSYVHRALICASLCEGKSSVKNVDINDDIKRTIEGLKRLGARIEIDDKDIYIQGINLSQRLKSVTIDAHESGSTLRFLIPISSLISKESIFKGSETLLNRPLSVYQEIYQEGFKLNKDLKITKSLTADNYRIQGNISSQFITGLLFALPLLNTDSTLTILEPYESKPYVDLSLDVLKTFNIKIKESDNKYLIPSKQVYKPGDFISEKDFSQAAFFAVLAAINNDLVLRGLSMESKQGDKVIFEILQTLGIKIEYLEEGIKVYKGKLKSGIFDISQTPDLGPILFVLGLFTEDYLTLTNISRLRIKESDRVSSMIKELSKFGARFKEEENQITIYPLKSYKKVEEVDSHNDHRIAMALTILSTVLPYNLYLRQSNAIIKSYPEFYNDLESLRI